MKTVRFPMFFEVCGYQTISLPDYIDADDEEVVKGYIAEEWSHIELPVEYDYVGDSGFDFDSPIEISDKDKDEYDHERGMLEAKIKKYLYERQELVPEFLGVEMVTVYGFRKGFNAMLDTYLKNMSVDRIRSFLDKYYGKYKKVKA